MFNRLRYYFNQFSQFPPPDRRSAVSQTPYASSTEGPVVPQGPPGEQIPLDTPDDYEDDEVL